MTTKNIKTEIFNQFDKKWALLTAGTLENFNTMTVSWGGMGTLWGKPVITVYVRPNRYTYGYMNDNDYFTVSFYPEMYRKDLGILGSLSGRDGDKVVKTCLTPVEVPHGMTFREAEATFVCHKLYAQDMDGTIIPDQVMAEFYASEPIHRIYIGEVVEVLE